MDVGDLSNAAALAASGPSAVLAPPAGFINTTNTSTSSNSGAATGWWTQNSSIVTPANADVMNQLCRVCGEPAAGFHFGAFTCEGCKSFFGRTYNNLSSISECKNGGVCVINKKNRTACKACRLRKCLMVGMSKSGSRYGRRSNWFKIHCLLQEQSHQARLKDSSSKSAFDKVLHSLDAANNNDTSINFPSASSTNLSSGSSQSRFYKSEEARILSPRPLSRPEMLHHELLRPEATRFPLWRGPPFFHPALSHMQLLNSPFFPFPQRFIMPFVNQIAPQIPITSLSSSSSESVTPRSTPSPKPEEQASVEDCEGFLRSLGPEQEEPMDLSVKNGVFGTHTRLDDASASSSSPTGSNSASRMVQEVSGAVECDGETRPPLDLTWKTS